MKGEHLSFSFRQNIERMRGYEPGYQPSGTDVIKLNTNENPYPPAPEVARAIVQVAEDTSLLRRYPKVLWDDFRQAAAEVLAVEPEMIVCGNGGDELLTMLARCCCDEGRPMAYPVPTYTLYPVLADIQGCRAIEVAFAENFRIPEALTKAGASLTILCNPNAPTGTFVAVEDVAQLAGRVNGVLAVDEAYVDFAEDNCLRLLKDFDNVVVLRSMSKGYSLAGMRFGYAVASARIVEAMIKVKDSYNVSVVTQAAATAAIRSGGYYRANVQKIIVQRKRLTAELGKLGFCVQPSHSNFVLARIDRPAAAVVYERLAEKGIFVRYFDSDGLRDKLRITVGTSEQNDALLQELAAIVG